MRLPIDDQIPAILASLQNHQNLVIEAPPGAGKTTRVPRAMLDIFAGGILVLEPRRIAARMAARRVAAELGERVGETAGYQVRFEEVAGPGTRLRFITEGVLNRRLLADPQLDGISAVVLDEFHERHLDGDLALAFLRRLQDNGRPDLVLVVMSATLNAEPISDFLGNCAVIRSEGRLFEVQVAYRPYSSEPLEERVASAVSDVLKTGLDGDVLVFLPGAAEIRRAARACDGIARASGLLVAPLHGDLPAEEQDRAVEPADRPKIILSTNVAESSITIEGVTAVIDSGLARVARDSHWTGLTSIDVQRISKASAIQRVGRAGRVRPGRAIRLYPEDDFVRRPDADTPEIRRRELSQMLLELEALGVERVQWLEAPPPGALERARELLERLGAPQYGTEMARYPVHPRLSRMLVEARRRGVVDDACRVAALLSSGDRYQDPKLLHLLESALPPRAEQIRKQLRRLVGDRGKGHSRSDDGLLISVLAGFPDRVGRQRSEREVQLSNGLAAEHTADPGAPFLLALDLEDRSDRRLPIIRLAAPIQPEWLIDVFPERMREVEEIVWNRAAERVEASSALLYDDLVIEESRSGKVDPVKGAGMLAERAIDAGLHRFADPELVEGFLARVRFASRHSGVPPIGEEDVRAALAELANGLTSFEQLAKACAGGGLLRALKSRLGGLQRELEEVAPERLPLGRRLVQVHYPADQPPWIESRLQDFFGMRETPRVGRGQVPVVVHLLAPNHRPVQMTSDLAGFWERLYPQVRRELMRRYPKHAWPENPG